MTDSNSPLVYIGPTGAGLGFQLSGVDVEECDAPEDALKKLRRFKEEGTYSLIFVDEGLAESILIDVERMNEDPVPAIVLLPNPAQPKNVAQEKMRGLMIKAIGSDILNN
jgi:V/A-type H+-transporting ATPase subunit F